MTSFTYSWFAPVHAIEAVARDLSIAVITRVTVIMRMYFISMSQVTPRAAKNQGRGD
ncbi:MAG: hypothetical protein IH877_04780 [Gemmatimonadetes bacterium]|nr:hypothetical protein [Gemmatimonadota bacterium]